tara:strand:+ start:140 stop:397 length:258 start_codon:yes stop_codon:yes gene_type:complete
MINAKDTRQGSHKVLKKALFTDAGQLIRQLSKNLWCRSREHVIKRLRIYTSSFSPALAEQYLKKRTDLPHKRHSVTDQRLKFINA